MNKREFLRTSAVTGLGLLLGDRVWARFAGLSTEQIAQDDAFWTEIRAKYRLKPDYINLESGYYSMQATPVLEAFIAKVREINYQASFYLRGPQVPDKAAVRDKLAGLAGCSPAELCITRNTTESIATVVSGIDWKSGDEAVQAEQDYGHMLAQFRLTARRYGSVNKLVNVPLDPRDDDEIVRLYAGAITPRTRLLMVSHMVNVTGQILPVRKIADMAHARGVDVLVDGAHAFAQFDFRIPDLGCRLLRRLAAQVARLSARHRHPVRPARQDSRPLADLRRLADDGRRGHHEAQPHGHAPRAHRSGHRGRDCVSQPDRDRRARKHACAISRTTGPAKCGRYRM